MDLANELVKFGNSVMVVTPEVGSIDKNFKFHTVRLKKSTARNRINLNFLEIPKVVRNFNPDVAHINYQTGGENLLILLLKALKIPTILTYHADHVLPLGRLIDVIQARTFFKFCDKILVQSKRDYDNMRARGLNENKLELFRFNGVVEVNFDNIEMPKNTHAKVRCICIAKMDSMHRYKGINEFLNILSEMKRSASPVQLETVIVGEGEWRNKFVNKSLELNLEKINFVGALSEAQKNNYLINSDFLVLPSTNEGEGFGRVALEALSVGIPVLVSKYAGISDLIRKYDVGVIYEPDSVISFEEGFTKIMNLKNDSEFSKRVKTLFEEEELDIVRTTKRTTKIYGQLMAKGGKE